MKLYTNWLRKQGVNIRKYPGVGYIDPSAYIDGSDYSKITIGHNVGISKDVIILTHDFTIWRALILKDPINANKRMFFSKEVIIGDNTVVGAKVVVLPGTNIGKNCIIGAGAVIKGRIPDNTIWVGNPAKQIMTIEEFTERHITKNDFITIG